MKPSYSLTLLAAFAAMTQPLLANVPVETAPASATNGERNSAQSARMDAAFDTVVEAGFTGFVAVSAGGETVYQRGHNSEREFGLDSPVDILSMTKSLTGAAIASLMAEGKIGSETRLGDVFSGVPRDKADITVHQLLTHSAGFPGALGDDLEYVSREEYLARAWAADLRFAPGSQYYYSNVGYSLLAAIIEKRTGQSYEAYLKQALFDPAGMASSGYTQMCCSKAGTRSIAETSWAGDKPSWHLIGNGGMISTPHDMLRWVGATQSDDAPWAAIRSLTHYPYQREGERASSHYGYGLVVEDHPQFGRAYWHNGGSRAFNGHWRYYADHGVTIFVTSDQWEIDPDSVERAIAAALLGSSD